MKEQPEGEETQLARQLRPSMSLRRMELKVKLSELLNSQKALARLASQPARARLAFLLSKLLSEVSAVLDEFHVARHALCQRLGTLNKEMNRYDFPPEALETFNAEYAELVGTEVSLSFEPLAVEALGDVQISGGDMLSLSWLIAE